MPHCVRTAEICVPLSSSKKIESEFGGSRYVYETEGKEKEAGAHGDQVRNGRRVGRTYLEL